MMKLKLLKLTTKLFFLTCLFCSTFITAQELSPVQNFTPSTYKGGNQNWGISQAVNKNIYVANDKGLLQFDGSEWRLYPSPNKTIMRSVNSIKNKIFTGCYMEFGFWEKDEFNNLKYTSLSSKLKIDLIEDEQFWNILNYERWVLFQSLHRIYVYDVEQESFTIITSETRIPKAFKIKDDIYFQKIGVGLFSIKNGVPVLLSDSEIIKQNDVVSILPLKNSILIQTQNKGSFTLQGNKLKRWQASSNAIKNTSIYSSLKLKDGGLVFGTISNGIYYLNKKGETILHVNQENGLQNNTVLSLFEDADNNIWLGLDNGISVINLKSPIKVFNDITGVLGAVYASVVYNNTLYIGTNQGLFYKKVNSQESFRFIEGTKGQVWCLKKIDNTLFCGHNSGTFLIKNNKATLISTILGTWDIKPIAANKNLLLQGTYTGLSILEKKNNLWKLKNKLEGFHISSRYFEMLSKQQLFVSHEYKGVFKIVLNDDFTKVVSYKKDHSAPVSFNSSIAKYNKELLYLSNSGLFKYNNSEKKFKKDTILTKLLFDEDTYYSGKLINLDSDLWTFNSENIVLLSPAKLNKTLKSVKIPLPSSLRKSVTGYESISKITDKTYLIGNTSGYILLDMAKYRNTSYKVKINTIEKKDINNQVTSLSLVNKNKIKASENNLLFKYSVPIFNKYTEVRYQYKLKGMYNVWSKWSTISNVEFKNLSYGSYTFVVRAKVGKTILPSTATHTFKIDRPWYLSNLMLVVYLLLLLGFFVLMHFFYNRYYNRQRHRIIAKKQREFALLQLENDKVIMKLKNDKLKSEVQSKTRELANSTMSIVKKNELLREIKKELSQLKNNEAVKPVIKIVNKNLTDARDWEMFQEAFNNTDRDFLKKVKLVHPSLTPNDLKLCAYLRLNLSSKEIAPLLNISPRSVEIKRYRLRKKMELPHKKSLVEYILEV